MTCMQCLSRFSCSGALVKMYQEEAEKCPYLKNKADFVEVVRCKDCIHRSTDDFRSFYCRKDDVGCKDDGFCSDGERVNYESSKTEKR